MSRKVLEWLAFCFVLTLPWLNAERAMAQCDPTVPTFYLDLSSNPDSFWISVDTMRRDLCCGNSNPDRCIRFFVTLSNDAVGINFNLYSGAVPPGALFYQIACGTSYPVGNDICLSGPGPHEITFCKPGNNRNIYSIKSIPKPSISDPITVSDACVDTLFATSLVEDSIVWRPVPYNAVYASYLSDTLGEDTVIVTPTGNYPPFVDYEVCGPVTGACGGLYFCDTVRVTFVSTFAVNILPDDPTICFGGTPALLFANVSGGAPPYSFLWNTGSTNDTIYSSQGSFSVQVTDSLGCLTVYDTIQVDSFALAIEANAGTDKFFCRNDENILLIGTVQAASGGRWFGGSGLYSSSDTSLTMTYTPTTLEKSLGSLVLSLVTTGNQGCPADTDQIVLNFVDNPLSDIIGPDSACKNKVYLYEAAHPTGSTINWSVSNGSILGPMDQSTVLVQFMDTGFALLTLTQINSVGCDSIITDTIFVAPTPEPEINGPDTACEYVTYPFSTSLNAGYTYQWSSATGLIQGSFTAATASISFASPGLHIVTLRVTNTFGCDSLVSDTVLVFSKPDPIISGEDSTCQNKIYTYTTPDIPGNTYMWNVSGGTVLGANNGSSLSVLWTTTGPHSISITETTPSGCDTTEVYPIIVLPTPAPVIVLPNDTACQNKIYTYSITPTIGHTYLWNVSGGTIIGANNTASINVLWGTPGTGTITVTQTSAFGCDSTVSESLLIVPTPMPVIVLPNDTA